MEVQALGRLPKTKSCLRPVGAVLISKTGAMETVPLSKGY